VRIDTDGMSLIGRAREVPEKKTQKKDKGMENRGERTNPILGCAEKGQEST